MGKLSGRISVRESGDGIPEVVVVAYDIDAKNAAELQRFAEHVSADFWDEVPGERLGSVVTDELGRFEMTYTDPRHGKKAERRASLAIFVVGPEGLRAGAPPLLHAPGEVRTGAAEAETYTIRIPLEHLRRAGIVIPGQAPPYTDAELEALDRRQAQAATGFAKRYHEGRTRVVRALEGLPKPVASSRPHLGVDLSMGVTLVDGHGLPVGATIEYDEADRTFLLRESPGGAPSPLAFKGVGVVSGKEGEPASGLSIDLVRREIQLRIPSSPAKLVEPPSPSRLLQRYSQTKADLPAPTPQEAPPSPERQGQ